VKRHGQILMLSVAFVGVLALTGCDNGAGAATASSSSGPPVGSAGVNLGAPSVHVAATDQLTFSPADATLQVGQIVEWANTGSVTHTVTFTNYPYLSDPTLAPVTWEVTFNKAGTYPYQCTIHAGMTGTLVVTGG
jgi:plastocyanin